MVSSPIGRLRIISITEGISFVLLLGIAMPLKYMAGIPEAVFIVGLVHGLLFILFCMALLNAWLACRWGMGPPAWIFLASLIPFAPLLVERWLRRQHHLESGRSSDPGRSTTAAVQESP